MDGIPLTFFFFSAWKYHYNDFYFKFLQKHKKWVFPLRELLLRLEFLQNFLLSSGFWLESKIK